MSAADYEDYEDHDERHSESRPVAKRTGREVRMQQIVVGQWASDMTESYSVIGMDTEGNVYRYDVRDAGWVPWSMEVLEPIVETRRRR